MSNPTTKASNNGYVFLLIATVGGIWLLSGSFILAAILGFITFIIAFIFIELIKEELESRRQNPTQKSEMGKIIVSMILVFAVIIGICVLIRGCSDDNSSTQRGDGVKTCRNCGRSPVVAGFGYCDNCYDGFVDWQEKHWTEKTNTLTQN